MTDATLWLTRRSRDGQDGEMDSTVHTAEVFRSTIAVRLDIFLLSLSRHVDNSLAFQDLGPVQDQEWASGERMKWPPKSGQLAAFAAYMRSRPTPAAEGFVLSVTIRQPSIKFHSMLSLLYNTSMSYMVRG